MISLSWLQKIFPHYALPNERVLRFLFIQSILASTSIFPFALMRLYQERWMHAAFDILLMVIFLSLIFFARRSAQSAQKAAWISAVCYIAAAWVVVANFDSYTMLWAIPVVVALYFILSPRDAFITNMVFLVGIWWFIADFPPMAEMITYSIVILLVNFFTLQFSGQLYRDNQALTLLSSLDPLTGAGNRRSLDKRLQELNTNKATTCSIMMVDLDHFKKVNDDHGHSVGDELLKNLVDFLKAYDNGAAEIYRFGGEEFCLLLNKSLDNVILWAENLCKEVEREFSNEPVPITVSIGLAEINGNTSQAYWLSSADEALYAAKQNGRNQIKVYRNDSVS